MQSIATQKFIRMSPRKLRVVARLAKEMKPEYAVEILPSLGKRAALPIQKVIKTAIANAVVKGMSTDNLTISEIQIGEGPRLKRFHAGARGMAKPYTHDLSHIRVVLTDEVKTKKPEAQNIKNQNAKTQVKTEKIDNKKGKDGAKS